MPCLAVITASADKLELTDRPHVVPAGTGLSRYADPIFIPFLYSSPFHRTSSRSFLSACGCETCREEDLSKVIIVEGGIGGLALADCLQQTGIEFVLVEKDKRLDPETGASIGILPNGARVLDQVGCYEDLLRVPASMKISGSHRHDGSLIGNIPDSLQLMHVR